MLYAVYSFYYVLNMLYSSVKNINTLSNSRILQTLYRMNYYGNTYLHVDSDANE